MKKFLTAAMAGLVLAAAPVTNIFAEENKETNTEVTGIVTDSTGTVQLTATVASSYAVQFPTTVDVSTSGATFDIKAKGDVDSAKKIVISEDNSETHNLVDAADSNNKVAITFASSGAISGANVGSTYGDTAKATITITHGTLSAGSYTCELPIVISLQDNAQDNA